MRLCPWIFIKTLLLNYIRKNDYYVFYLHPFELTRQQVPSIGQLRSCDQYYISQGIRDYGKRIEWIIGRLQKHGYEFVTFEHLMQIMAQEHPVG